MGRAIAAALASLLIAIAGCQPSPSETAPLAQTAAPLPSVAATSAASAAASPSAAAVASAGPSASVPVAIDPASFTTTIDNPWFPLKPGTTYTYEGTEGGDRLFETFEVRSETKVVAGVTCVVIRDLLKVNGVLEERTEDWYVQDLAGNVWYFGEDTATLDEHGKVTSTEGTWTAGVDDATPGIFMPANPTVGYAGEQEHYVGTAEDRFVVLLTNAKVKVKLGSFSNALVTLEWTVLEPDVLSEKVYVQGIGQVKEFDVAGGTEALQLTKLIKP